MRQHKDDIDRFFDHNLNLATRTIYMGSIESSIEHGESGTDAAMAENFIKCLHILESEAPTGDKEINVIMNNTGGDEYHGFAIFDMIQACKNPITITVFGHAMSMGSIILQAADRRIMAPHARMMIHYGTPIYTNADDHVKTNYKWTEECKRFSRVMESLYLDKIKQKHPKFTRQKIQEMLNFDTFLSGKQAVELGLADHLLEKVT